MIIELDTGVLKLLSRITYEHYATRNSIMALCLLFNFVNVHNLDMSTAKKREINHNNQ